MKNLKCISFFIVTILCLTNTTCEDDNNFDLAPEINIINNNIIQIENTQNTFNVGENITIETNISLEQTATEGENILLSDYDYSEIDQSSYNYKLVLYKQNGFGTISRIPLTEFNIIEINGNTSIDTGQIFVETNFNGTDYKNKFSITLAEAGSYFLAGERLLIDNNGKIIIYGGVNEFASISIATNIINVNADNAYAFTVN